MSDVIVSSDIDSFLSSTGTPTISELKANGTGKSITKDNSYFKNGGLKLKKFTSDDEMVALFYEGSGVNAKNLVMRQFSGGNAEGEIKFLGNTPANSNTVRVYGKNVDIGFDNKEDDGTATTLTKIHSDTNIVANKNLVFTDTRDATEGLRFHHTGVRSTNGQAGRDEIQMGMYGSYPDSTIGEFKITHKIGTASNTDVLSVSPSASEVKIHKPLNLGNVPVYANNTAASSLDTGDVYKTSTGVLMIKY